MFGAPTQEVLLKRRASWTRVRAKGKWRFILFEGVLTWAVYGTCFALLQDFVFHKPDAVDREFIPFEILFWLAVGYFDGRKRWNKGEELIASSDGLPQP